MKNIKYFFVFFMVALLAACNGSSDSPELQQPKLVELLRIDIMPSPVVTKGISALTLAKGVKQPFIATGHYSDGSAQNITASVSWKVASPSIAVINSAGLLTGIDVGDTTITASEKGVASNQISVTVSAATINAIQVIPATVSIAKGQTKQLVAQAIYSDSTTADISNSATWLPADTNIITVTSDGVLTGVEAHATTLTASKDGITSNLVDVTVTEATITAIDVTPARVSVAKGQTEQLIAKATYSDGTTADISNSVTWLPADVNTVVVNSDGVLTGTEVNTTTVTASKDGIISNLVDATVTAAIMTAIDVTPTSISVAKGNIQQLVAMAVYSDGTTTDISNSVTWLPADINTITVTPDGLLTGVDVNTTTVTASKNGITSNLVDATVTAAVITAIDVTSVNAFPTNVFVEKGKSEQFVANATYSDGTTANVSTSVAWLPANMDIASITSEGLLSGVERGKTGVTASKDGINSNIINVSVTQWTEVPGLGEFLFHDDMYRNWSEATDYCFEPSFGGSSRLPTIDELTALYNIYPDNRVNTELGWQTNYFYWTSTDTVTPGFHRAIILDQAYNVEYVSEDSARSYVTCIRIR